MSSGPNHRRGHGRIQERGPTYENNTPNKGCNATHVARSRAKWVARASRAERRTGKNWPSFYRPRYRIPALDVDLEQAELEQVEACDFSATAESSD